MRKIENEARIAAAGGRVGKLHKPVEITPEKIARRMRKKLARKNKKDAKQLGRHKFQDKPDEVLLSEELPKTLRHLATSSLPLLDYQHSLEANGYIEPKHVDRVKKTKKVLHSQNTAVADFLKDQGVDV
ncbi:uncharacterized protein MONOS_1091 [Monocercomonoides exilis]|uniref:uncharacterized protein n=1 Tax=Monocercomonoides exilis TaxID=2049356 RepID=UPI00355AB24E|nr:hypothetical protein MONOS_1091 [Monocercomonoides exilis]|eukprot:MONOS_1091.1-p1 / transcript=MONOS_1091.1 / gene=MONOS_1091 / organism=Monocercomonoides_exilis_PA203 / gene_product=unspecified product / transcript_product=unspecified product / location=Mono_scaffold00018:191034-191568(-) / protein_length=128 / sequence_SO=supercontig / SO=protein_coding / is_pseudo=false